MADCARLRLFSRADTSDSSRSEKSVSVCLHQAEKLQGAIVRTILLDEFTSLAIVVWFCLLVTTLGDLFARNDLCVWKKAVWAVAVLTLPMGAFAYMAVQSRAITDRKAARLLQSDRDSQSVSSSSISDEIAEAERLVPLIQHAIEIRGILEAEDPTTTMAELEQIGLSEQAESSGHVCAGEPNRDRPGHSDHPRFPAVAA